MASTPQALPSPDEILEREAGQKRVATIAAAASAVLLAIAAIVEQLLNAADPPSFDQVDLVQSFSAAAAGKEPPPSFITAAGNFKLDHAAETILIFGLRGIAFALMAPMILLLLRGARDRGGPLSRVIEPIALFGFALLLLGTVAVGFLEPAFYRDARDNGFTPEAIRDAYASSPILYASVPVLIGSLAVCIPIAMASLQAMRVGLLPRVLGFMGVLVGLLFVVSADSTGLVRAFWIAALAWIVSGKLRPELAPAWATGTAVEPQPRQPPAPRPGKGGGKGTGGKAKADQAAGGKKPKLDK